MYVGIKDITFRPVGRHVHETVAYDAVPDYKDVLVSAGPVGAQEYGQQQQYPAVHLGYGQSGKSFVQNHWYVMSFSKSVCRLIF